MSLGKANYLSSRENPKVQRVVRLLTSRKERWSLKRYIVEGPKFVYDLLRREGPVDALYISEKLSDEVLSLLEKEAYSASFDVYILPEDLFQRISDATTSQGVLAEVCFDAKKVNAGLSRVNWLALNGIQDPGNVGALVRSAVAVGGFGLMLDEASADPFSPKAVRASAGLVGEVDVLRSSDLSGPLQRLRQDGYLIYGLERYGERVYLELDYSQPFVVVLGAEGRGISSDLTGFFEATVSIPTSQIVESINVSIAGSLVLFESSRQKYL